MSKADREAMKAITLGCWWPSRAFPKPCPNWPCIADELEYLARNKNNACYQSELTRLAMVARAQKGYN
jgi:hypothetical protein